MEVEQESRRRVPRPPGDRGGPGRRAGGPAGRAAGPDRRERQGRARGEGQARERAEGHNGYAAVPVEEALAPEVLDELRHTARPQAFWRAARALATAVVALAEDDPEESARAAQVAKQAAPRSAAVREALGLALYQLEEYRAARNELAAAQRISGSGDLTAVLADIERALGRPERAIELFETADRERMAPDTATELLIVAASAYGDLGQPAAGVALIRRHARWPADGRLRDHHLRLAYAEGALAEQAGDREGARRAFARVVEADPDFYDAEERLRRL